MGGAGAIILLWLLVTGVPGLLTVWLCDRTWKRRKTTRVAAKAAAAIAVGGAIVGTSGTLFGAAKALGALGEGLDPSQKARLLAEGISTAMNCTAFGLVVWTPAIVTALLLLRKKPTAA